MFFCQQTMDIFPMHHHALFSQAQMQINEETHSLSSLFQFFDFLSFVQFFHLIHKSKNSQEMADLHDSSFYMQLQVIYSQIFLFIFQQFIFSYRINLACVSKAQKIKFRLYQLDLLQSFLDLFLLFLFNLQQFSYLFQDSVLCIDRLPYLGFQSRNQAQIHFNEMLSAYAFFFHIEFLFYTQINKGLFAKCSQGRQNKLILSYQFDMYLRAFEVVLLQVCHSILEGLNQEINTFNLLIRSIISN